MGTKNIKESMRLKRKIRIRKSIFGTIERPRLSIYRSLKHIYAQIVDDSNGKTLVSASTVEKSVIDNVDTKNNISKAVLIGKLVAERALNKGIKKVVFDRNGFLYHGRIKALSDGAREGGLDF